MTGSQQEIKTAITIPGEAFTGPLGRAVLEASCYPLPDKGYRITVEEPRGSELNGDRPWRGWPVYGEMTASENPNGSFERVLGEGLAIGGLCLSFAVRHDNYLVTPQGELCWRYTIGVEQRTARPQDE